MSEDNKDDFDGIGASEGKDVVGGRMIRSWDREKYYVSTRTEHMYLDNITNATPITLYRTH